MYEVSQWIKPQAEAGSSFYLITKMRLTLANIVLFEDFIPQKGRNWLMLNEV